MAADQYLCQNPGRIAAVRAAALASPPRLFNGIENERFYFVHSYGVLQSPRDAVVTTAQHEDATFVAAVERGSLSTTQFHPEKSGAAGIHLLSSWLQA